MQQCESHPSVLNPEMVNRDLRKVQSLRSHGSLTIRNINLRNLKGFNLMSWRIEELTGYKPKTTFWDDFTIADAFGLAEIRDTFERSFRDWKHNVEYITELVMVLNHKAWHWDGYNEEFMILYSRLYRQYNDLAYDYLEKYGTKEDLQYYFSTLD